MAKMDLNITGFEANIEPGNRSLTVKVTVDRGDALEELLGQFELSEIIASLGIKAVLDEIGKDEAAGHFGLIEEA